MSLGAIQYVAGIVNEVLCRLDPLGLREELPNFEYDIETALLVPQAYLTLRGDSFDEDEAKHLLSAVYAALDPNGVGFGSLEAASPIAKVLLDELQAFAAALKNEEKDDPTP